MKKKGILFILLILINITLLAQIGINTNDPDPTVVLDINSNNKGILIPSLTTGVREAYGVNDNPADGVIVYDSQIRKFYVWKKNVQKWYMINPWNLTIKGGTMNLPSTIASTVKIHGDIELNGSITASGSVGYTGIVNPDNPGSRIIVKNGIITDIEGSVKHKVIFDPYDDYDITRNASIAFVSETNPGWTLEKDQSFGNPDAFDVDRTSGNEGFTNVTFTANLNPEYGETKFLLKDGSTAVEEIIMNSIQPVGYISVPQTTTPFFGHVFFTRGTGDDSWILEADQNLGNPNAVIAAPSSGTNPETMVYFVGRSGELGTTTFLLKSGGRTLYQLSITQE